MSAESSTENEKQSFGVTPPQMDTMAMRAWLRTMAVSKGWTDLEWSDEVDAHGNGMGRLLGRRPS
jgi:hypothetical protein